WASAQVQEQTWISNAANRADRRPPELEQARSPVPPGNAAPRCAEAQASAAAVQASWEALACAAARACGAQPCGAARACGAVLRPVAHPPKTFQAAAACPQIRAWQSPERGSGSVTAGQPASCAPWGEIGRA